MSHLVPDRLVLLALGKAVTDEAETDHVDRCDLCRDELDSLGRVVNLGRRTRELADLPPLPERVWRNVATATIEPDALPELPHRRRGVRAVPRRSAARRGLIAVAATVAAATVTAVAVARGLDRSEPIAADPVIASAELTALPGAPADVTGAARVLADGAGSRLHVRVTGLPLRPGYYEIWLISPDTERMVSVGVLRDGGDEELPLPATIDLRQYRLVDVSAEDYDGNVLHSGRSLVRGTLSV